MAGINDFKTTWYSTQDIARLCGVSATTVRRMLKAYGVPVFRYGRHIKVREEDVIKMIKDNFKSI